MQKFLKSGYIENYHDWFIYAFARCNGFLWFIDSCNSVNYRQHASNVFGANVGIRPFISRLNRVLNGEGFNFGPKAEQNHSVQKLIEDLSDYWDFKSGDEAFKITDNIPFHEAGLLKLSCDKALFYLKWQANMEYKETIKFTSEWYYNYYKNKKNILDKTLSQISEYESIAKKKGLAWTE